ncbi:MAG: SAM-dependent chlorinase/fluorinase [Acidimicrobiia bacterium]|nr:SAM-dependent chlorinase/fluorinase [Acidimicrobiia bacterium]
MARRPLIALLTDFGTRDHYAAAMKGVVLDICPDVTLVDITHDIPPHDILGAALELAAVTKYFPRGTIFLTVVDPGVGTGRQGLAVEGAESYFVAPDNGVLTLALRATPPKRIVDLTQRRYARPSVSRTFEGRDRFAPAAAWLAKGVDLAALGRPVHEWQEIAVPEAEVTGGTATGTVLRVDRFGNLVTNIDRRTFERIAADGRIQLTVGGHPVERVVDTYAEAGASEVCALFGSTEHLEIAVNGGSAAETLALGRGAPVELAPA